ncbi:class I SAM-dependent methyltransferase [Nocardioides sp.]|uniref:SAM-dependent methyltransferase n=1 Tax=Nocardioides sp. TaxID=35761 RepID=UPI002D7FA0BC|nr:class I SAM-dependent methyltransferase [Nocardioides sp.]HET8960661.1 class I SAM-dependent methyltransferase [Nocardioides sp.]
MNVQPLNPAQAFWEDVHVHRGVHGVSWWQRVPRMSLDLIEAAGLGPEDPIIDVGSGWSTLIDHLLDRGHLDVTAIDLSANALQAVRDRLGGRDVRLEVADVLDLDQGRRYALWHDRAVFHFLTRSADRDAYRASLDRSLDEQGWAVVATFGPAGPERCSGLPVVRYSHEELAAEFPGYELVATSGEDHLTPWGSTQQFTAVLLRRR